MMTSQLCQLAGLLLFLVFPLQSFALPTTSPSNPIRIVAYVPNWIDTATYARTIDYPKLTHINVAFENPKNDAGDFSFSPANQPLIDQSRNAGVKILLSIGGGSASSDKKLIARYEHLLSNTNRPAFVAKLKDYLIAHKFDGIDIDLEGPGIPKTYGPFITDLSHALKPHNLLLTAAVSKGYGGDKISNATLDLFDFVNIMAYDGTGYWDPKTPGQHSSISYARDNVRYWLDRGLPKSKAVLGVPFYGYGFGKAFRKRDYPYKDIFARYPGAESVDQVGETIWYNGIPTLRTKAQYVLDEHLSGVMIWSLDLDVPAPHSLLNALHQTLYPQPLPSPASRPSPLPNSPH